jgi:hypothetical protein
MHLYAQLLAEFEYDMLFFVLRSLITLEYFGLDLSPGILVSCSNYPISDFSFGTEIIG